MYGRNDANITSNAVREVLAQRGAIAVMIIHNDDSAARFVQLFNARSANVNLGTTTPDMVIQVGADTTLVVPFGDEGQTWETAFSYAVTTTATGSTGPTSAWVSCSIK